MFLNQAAQAAIVIGVGDDELRVPRFTLGDFAAWSEEIDSKRRESALAGLDPNQRFHYIAGFNILPTTLPEMRQLILSASGTLRVLNTCLGRAVVFRRNKVDLPAPEPLSADAVKAILATTDNRDQAALALLLADLRNTSTGREAAPEAAPAGEQPDDGGADPLMKAVSSA